MHRRHFLSLLAASAGALSTRSFFDMGQAWQRHASGLVVPMSASGVSGVSEVSGVIVRCDVDTLKFLSTITMRGDDGTDYMFGGVSPLEDWNRVGQRIRFSHFAR